METFLENWLNFGNYLIENKNINLTEEELIDLEVELSSSERIDELEYYINGKRTSAIESFHSIVNIYIKKGKNYGIEQYYGRHSLAVLHQHENKDLNLIDDENYEKYQFIDEIKYYYYIKINGKNFLI